MTELPFPVADPATPDAIETGFKLFRGPVDFVKGVVATSGLPADDRIEFCFAGRSNVGKSSLINALTERRNLARTSNTPGRTQEINYFDVGGTHYMVDVPGYGYAKAPLAQVEKWQKLLRAYLAGRVGLRRVFLLIDSRHGAKQVDDEIMTLLDRAAAQFQVVMTKTDKAKKSEREAGLAATRKILNKHPAAYPEILITSSEKGEGIDQIRAVIAGLD